jgi:hypothetical protein
VSGSPTGWPLVGSHSRTVLSLPAASRVRPSGSWPNATAVTAPVWSLSGRILRHRRHQDRRSHADWPVAGSHSRTVASELPVASRVRPSGSWPNATALTARVWPVSGSPNGWPVAGFHSRTVSSELTVASRVRPSDSWPNATALTARGETMSGSPNGWPVVGFHSRAVPSSVPVASRVRPLGRWSNAAAIIARVWPVSGSPNHWPVAGSRSRIVPL